MTKKEEVIFLIKVKVAKVTEIPKGKAKAVKVGEVEVAIYHTENDQWYATSDICTHEHCNLGYDGGKLDGYEIECDCHGSKFDIRDGKVLLPPAVEPLKTYQVTVKGEEVFVE